MTNLPAATFIVISAFVSVTINTHAQSPAPLKQFISIENSSGAVIRRVRSDDGRIPGSLFLGQNQEFRVGVFDPNTNRIGNYSFTTGRNGSQLSLPRFRMRLPALPDTDGDGLSDDAERIVGTSRVAIDTDGDGISDWTAILEGLDPLSGIREGLLDSTDTPGRAVDLWALDNYLVVADSEEGVSVFNIFNRMSPVIIAQVDTPGEALAVASWSNQVVVADATGMHIIDIEDPPAARIDHSVSAAVLGGGTCWAVAAAHGMAYLGTSSGQVTAFDLTGRFIRNSFSVPPPVEDLFVMGSNLFVYADEQLRIYDIRPQSNFTFPLVGSVSSPGQRNGRNGRARLFVGLETAYLTHRRGYNTIDIRNPSSPVEIKNTSTLQFGWKHVKDTGSGFAVAASSPNSTFDGPHNMFLYDSSNPSVTDAVIREFPTPGIARSVEYYNGITYVADDTGGMSTIVARGLDVNGVAPTGTLHLLGSPYTVFPGTFLYIQAEVEDDVQVRNVEFYVNDARIVTDGSYPFEAGWQVESNFVGGAFDLRARVSDTGGNFRWLSLSQDLIVQPDNSPPVIVAGAITLDASTGYFQLQATMTDNVLVQDVRFYIDGVETTPFSLGLGIWEVRPGVLGAGTHTLTIEAIDSSGNTASIDRALRPTFSVTSRPVSLQNFESSARYSVLSRPYSLGVFGSGGSQSVTSRPLSLENQ